MKTEFILGDATQDFEKAIANRTVELVKDDPLCSVLIITPPQATSSTEQMILREIQDKTGVPGLMGVDISTVNRTAVKIITETRGMVQKTLSPAVRSMAIKEILNENKDEIKSLVTKQSSKDLPYMLTQTISELKSQNINPENLKSIETSNNRIKDKLDDLALIYENYNQKTSGYLDSEDRIRLASKAVCDSEYVKNTHVIVYGFNSLSARTADFITALMETAKSFTITFFQPDKNSPDKSVYDMCSRSRNLIGNAATGGIGITELPCPDAPLKKAPQIVRTAKNLFSRNPAHGQNQDDGAVNIGHAQDIKTEVDGAIAQIVKLNAENGIPYNKIALVCGKSGEYLPVIKNRFKSSGVPCFTGDKRSLMASNIASFIITAFKLSISRPTKSLILEHAAAGFCNLSENQRYALENYAYQKISSGFAFFKEFDSKIEKARVKLISPIEELRKKTAKAKTITAWIGCVEDYLASLYFDNKVQRKVNRMIKAGSLKEADYHEQAVKRIFTVLEEAKEICGNSPVYADFIGVLEAGIRAEEIAVIPQTGNEVVCGDIYNLYIPDVSALFILGMNVGSIPDYKNEAGILNEQERELIFNAYSDFKPANRSETRKLLILKAFARPNDYLYLSYTENAGDKPSLLMDHVKELNPGGDVDLAKIAPIVKNNALEFTARRLRNLADELPVEEWGDEFEQAVYKNEEFAEHLENLKNIKNRADFNLKLDSLLSSKLYGNSKMSATRTQTFYECPYKYFMNYGLNVKKMQEADISVMSKGNFAHSMLENIIKRIIESKKDWQEITDDEFDEIIEIGKQKAIDETKEYNYSDANAVILDGFAELVKRSANNVRKFALNGALKPYAVEENLKEKCPDSDLTGKIDRIDTADLNGQKYFGIVDYKSSNKKFDINTFLGGTNIQLIFYLLIAMQMLDEKYLPAGAAFMETKFDWNDEADKMNGIIFADDKTAGDLYGKQGRSLASIVQSESYSIEEAKLLIEYLGKLLDDAKERITRGDIGITPASYQNSKCKYCDYRSICFKDEDDKTGDRIIEKLDKGEAIERISKELGEENGMD